MISQYLGVVRAIAFNLKFFTLLSVLELCVKNFWTFAFVVVIVGIHEIVQVGDFVEKAPGSVIPVFQVVLSGSVLLLHLCSDFRQGRQVEKLGAKSYATVLLIRFAVSFQSLIFVVNWRARIARGTLRRLMGSITAFIVRITFAVVATASDLLRDVRIHD